MIKFIDKKHEERYNELIDKDNTPPRFWERQSMFYIISGVDKLYNHVDKLYDFENKMIIHENNLIFSTSEKYLLALAYSFCFFNYEAYPITDTFAVLDDKNFELVMRAIRMRFRPE